MDGYIVESRTLGGSSHFDYRFLSEVGKKRTYEEDNKLADQHKAFSIETVYLYSFVLGCISFVSAGLSSVKISMVATKDLVPLIT